MAVAVPSLADEVLREHGFDGDRLSRLCEAVLSEGLRRRGSVLWPDRREDLHSYLCLTACRIATNYDPGRSRPGYSFSSYMWDVLDRRITDWFRQTFGDSRYPAGPNKRRIPLASLLSLDATLPVDYDEPASPSDEPDTFADALVELGRDISPQARWTLVNIVGRMVDEELGELAAIAAAGISRKEGARLLKQLRAELAGASVALRPRVPPACHRSFQGGTSGTPDPRFQAKSA